MVSKYAKGSNFWEAFPEYRALETYNTFYDKDKSKNHNSSSDVMWAITFCLRKESPMYNLPNKWELAARDIIKDKDFNWDKIEDIVAMFKESSMSQAERSLLAWEELMKKRDKYLKSKDYYFDEYLLDDKGDNVVSKTGRFITIKGTADQLDSAFSITPKMYSDFYKIKKEIEEDEIKRGKGNRPKSLTDSNEL